MNLEEICQLKFYNGDLIWPVFRFQILELNKLKLRENKKNYSINGSKLKLLKNIIQGLLYIRIKRRDILYIAPTILNFKFEKKYKNILYDYYMEVYSQKSQLLEEGFSKGWRLPREKSFSSIFEYFNILAHILAIVFPCKSNKDDIEKFCKTFPKISYLQIRRAEKKIFWLEKIFKLYLKMIKPRIIMMNAASYGGYIVVFIRIAKEFGIKVAEIQHGLISKIDDPYNLEKIEIKNLKKYTLDYMLTFGDYWNTQINIGARKIVVGNPNINFYLENNLKTKTKIDYLFVSQWMVTDRLIQLAVDLRKKLKKEKIAFKLHPNEILNDNQIKILKENKIDICTNNIHVYEYLSMSKNVVGHSSTTLVEAAAFNKNIFYLNDEMSKEYIPKEIGVQINTVDDILIKKRHNQKYDSEYYYKKDFFNNYIEFLKKELNYN